MNSGTAKSSARHSNGVRRNHRLARRSVGFTHRIVLRPMPRGSPQNPRRYEVSRSLRAAECRISVLFHMYCVLSFANRDFPETSEVRL
jgi:hypothetical protein